MMKKGMTLGTLMLLGMNTAFAQSNVPLVTFTNEQLKPEFTIKIDDQDLNQMKNSLSTSLQGLNDLAPITISINDLYKAGDEKSIYAATQAIGEQFTDMAKKVADMTARVYRLSALTQTTTDVTDLYHSYQMAFQANYDSMILGFANPNPKIIAAMKACVSDMCATQLRDVLSDLVVFGTAINTGIKFKKMERFDFSFEFKSSLVRASLGETFTELNKPNQENSAYRTLLAAILSPFVVAEKGVVKTGENLVRLIAAPKTVHLKLFALPVTLDQEQKLEEIRAAYRETLTLVDANYKAYQADLAKNGERMANDTAAFFGWFGKVVLGRISMIDIETQARNMQTNGISSSKWVAGFSAEGAMAFNHELTTYERKDHTKTTGMQILPYEIHVMTDGTKKVVASLFGFMNMNELSDSSALGHESEKLLTSIFDKVKFFELIWDDHYSLSNMKSLDFKVVDLGLSVPIVSTGDFSGGNYATGSKENYSLIQLRAGADIGFGDSFLDTPSGTRDLDGSYRYTEINDHGRAYKARKVTESAFNSNLSVGLEIKNKSPKLALSTQVNYLYQYKGYSPKVNAYEFSKLGPQEYWDNGAAKQRETITWTEYEYIDQKFAFSALQVKVDLSKTCKNGTSRIGFAATWNQPLSIKLGEENIENNYNEVLSGKLYFKF